MAEYVISADYIHENTDRNYIYCNFDDIYMLPEFVGHPDDATIFSQKEDIERVLANLEYNYGNDYKFDILDYDEETRRISQEDMIISGEGKNTKISYPLRIAGEKRVEEWKSVIVPGKMTQEQAKIILNCVDLNESGYYYFRPCDVGFSSSDDDLDSCYFYELSDDCFEYTDEEATLDITPSQLVNRFIEMIR